MLHRRKKDEALQYFMKTPSRRVASSRSEKRNCLFMVIYYQHILCVQREEEVALFYSIRLFFTRASLLAKAEKTQLLLCTLKDYKLKTFRRVSTFELLIWRNCVFKSPLKIFHEFVCSSHCTWKMIQAEFPCRNMNQVINKEEKQKNQRKRNNNNERSC